MLLWFAGLSFVIVWQVFHDTSIDHRLVMAGALLPDAIDPLFGGARVLHSMLGSVVLLTLVMLGTRSRRAARRRLLAVPIGTFLHLALDGIWTDAHIFWWPFLGRSFRGTPLPSLHRPLSVLALQEVAGALALGWAWARFRLGEPERRLHFFRTGRLGRDLAS
jgi:hypothetical protein